MRLIDADKLMLSLSDWELQEAPIHTYEKPKEFTADDMQRMIWRTIRDCESAVEEQPIVPAIPIEWIKKWCNEEHNRKSLEERLLKRYGVITMLEDWEKENEAN